jgi:hypothetical protein
LNGSSQLRGGLFIGAGAILVSLGIFLPSGWPLVVGGFVLLVAGTGAR